MSRRADNGQGRGTNIPEIKAYVSKNNISSCEMMEQNRAKAKQSKTG
ncbi:MAG: hypothetical protein IJC39_04650 [Firmicutes bacterium]|nr:hypothetical protein [Bacillota bacterium]